MANIIIISLHTSVSFTNALSRHIQIQWLNPDMNEEVLVSNEIHPGSVDVQKSHPHKFVVYDHERPIRKEFLVDAGYGERQYFLGRAVIIYVLKLIRISYIYAEDTCKMYVVLCQFYLPILATLIWLLGWYISTIKIKLTAA